MTLDGCLVTEALSDDKIAHDLHRTVNTKELCKIVSLTKWVLLPLPFVQLCISDGRLKTAASYLIIIQNLEASTVSRQVWLWYLVTHVCGVPVHSSSVFVLSLP